MVCVLFVERLYYCESVKSRTFQKKNSLLMEFSQSLCMLHICSYNFSYSRSLCKRSLRVDSGLVSSVNCQSRSLLNRFRTEQGDCGACRRKWRLTDTDLCPCGETQTMSHIIESCPLTKLNGGLSQLHSADEDAVSWLTNYGK